MKNIFLFVLLGAWFCSSAQEEKVVDLQINPQLYNQHKHLLQNGKKQLASNYFLSPQTLSLPFVDDFSRYHLKSYEPVENFPVVDTVNRTIALTDDTLTFRYSSITAWHYTYDTVTDTKDSTALPSIRFVLNDDSSDVSLPTDTLTVWPLYYHNYTFDTLGVALDSTLAPYDSLFYSQYYGVRDTNALWLENYVYVNDNYATNKLSYGIATFDGLNEFGLPHNNNSITNYGSADTLTSLPINLEGLGTGDSVFFSFAFEPKGIGDKPEAIDSLVLEFKLLGSQWEQMGGWAGSDSVIANPVFKDTLFQLTNPFFFVQDFQFRIRNKSTITGNNDHWHIDYVYLHRNRSISEDDIRDIAISEPAENFLSDYTSMPWYQFADSPSAEKKDSSWFTFKNNYATVGPIAFTFRIYEGFTNTPIYTQPPGLSFDIDPFLTYSYPIAGSLVQYAPAQPDDSVQINLEVSFTENVAGSSITLENNVSTTSVLFDNYFAYDDGSAERAYGLEGPGLKKFAYEFTLNQPDTLRALQFHFSQINDNLLLNELTLVVWNQILTEEEDTLYYQERVPFHYIPERNGFTQYVLDTPVLVQDKFYVGWQQLFPENIQLGLDLNNTATEHMYFYTNGTWKQSTIEGAPMIRAVVGKYEPLIGTGVEHPKPVASGEAFIYPNPSEDYIYLRTPYETERVEVYDVQGKLVKTFAGSVTQLDVKDLNSGMYILRILSGKNQPQSLRFVKL